MREPNTFFDKDHAFINVFCSGNNESMPIRGLLSDKNVAEIMRLAESKGMRVKGGSLNGHTHLKQLLGQSPVTAYEWAVEAAHKDEWLPDLYLLALAGVEKNDLYFCKSQKSGLLQVYVEEPWSACKSVYRVVGMNAEMVRGQAGNPQKANLSQHIVEGIIDVLQKGEELRFFDQLSAK